MLSDVERAGLSDIVLNIELAQRFVEGFDYDRFADDMRTFYALTLPGDHLRGLAAPIARIEGASSRDSLASNRRIGKCISA